MSLQRPFPAAPRRLLFLFLGALAALGMLLARPAAAQEPTPAPPAAEAAAAAPAPDLETVAGDVKAATNGVNFVWTLVAAFLVFFMQAGFAMVETGLTRAKNAVNIMMKNLMDFAVGSLGFWAVGFGLMFGLSKTGWFGTDGFFFQGKTEDPWFFAFWMFQVVFAATAATIVSGAMAERTRFSGYLIYSLAISVFIYPVFGSWAWGNLFHTDNPAWLAGRGFIDFAGSTVVHSVGGWAALAGAIVLGPRIGKYDRSGKPVPIPGHNLPLAALGVFILWFGWFGFNAGSTTSGTNLQIAQIAVNTNLAAAAGCAAALITAWIRFGKPDSSMALNGALAGLVGITAGCANVNATGAVLIGLAAGVLVVFSVLLLERARVDDPVGAVSVHGVCGAWGTLAVAFFDTTGKATLGAQLLGIGAAFAWTFPLAFLLFKLIAATVGLRVSREEELEGLDLSEHDNRAYPDFAIDPTSHTHTGGLPGAQPRTAPAGAPAPAEA